MFKELYSDKDLMVDWCREAKEELKTMRFCPNCNQLVELILREHQYYQNFYACSVCGELILKKETIRHPCFKHGEKYKERHSHQKKKDDQSLFTLFYSSLFLKNKFDI